MKICTLKNYLPPALAFLVLGISACGGGSSNNSSRFLVRITNIGAESISTSNGINVPAVFAPGAATVNVPSTFALFTPGQASSPGLEIMAEDGGGVLLASEASAVSGVKESIAFGIPDGQSEPGPLTPGNSYSFEVEAEEGDYLNFATMFVQSNDLFIAPVAEGLPLFDESGLPRSGDITSEVLLWDAGTEVNEEPGLGMNQAPRQSGPNVGEVENGVVRLLNENDFPLPPLENTVVITLTPLP